MSKPDSLVPQPFPAAIVGVQTVWLVVNAALPVGIATPKKPVTM